MDLLGAVDADAAGAHVAGALEVDALPARRDVSHRESLFAQVGGRLGVDLDAGQDFFVTDAAAWVRVGGLDELGDGALAVPFHMGWHALRDGPQLTVNNQAAIVVTDQEGLHHHAAVAALATGGGVAGAHRSVIREVEHHAPAVVTVDRLHGHGVPNRRGRGGGLVLGAHHFRAGDRDASRLQQPVGELLV